MQPRVAVTACTAPPSCLNQGWAACLLDAHTADAAQIGRLLAPLPGRLT